MQGADLDRSVLAELMLPDGAHLRPEDWTIFYLNQTRKNATTSVLQHESPAAKRKPSMGSLTTSGGATSTISSTDSLARKDDDEDIGELLYVINCVRMKEDKSVRRGAMVKALAVATDKPYIHIYKVSRRSFQGNSSR